MWIDFQHLRIVTDLPPSTRSIDPCAFQEPHTGDICRMHAGLENIPITKQPTNPATEPAKETQAQADNQHPQQHIQPHYTPLNKTSYPSQTHPRPTRPHENSHKPADGLFLRRRPIHTRARKLIRLLGQGLCSLLFCGLFGEDWRRKGGSILWDWRGTRYTYLESYLRGEGLGKWEGTDGPLRWGRGDLGFCLLRLRCRGR